MDNVQNIFREAAGANQSMLHLRHDGRSHDVVLERLGVSSANSDYEIKAAVSGHFDLHFEQIQKLVVERHENGNLTLRPEAVFG